MYAPSAPVSRLTGAGLLALGAGLLAGCSFHASVGHTSTAPSSRPTQVPSHSQAVPTAGRRPLAFSLVEPLGEQQMGHDPGCGYGAWNPNSTGIDDPYRGQATAIWQFDCWAHKGEVFPNAGQQAIFITFATPDQATTYVHTQAGQAWQAVGYLQDQANVLEVHQGRLTLDRIHFLKDVQASCGGCGTVTTTALANGATPGFTGNS